MEMGEARLRRLERGQKTPLESPIKESGVDLQAR